MLDSTAEPTPRGPAPEIVLSGRALACVLGIDRASAWARLVGGPARGPAPLTALEPHPGGFRDGYQAADLPAAEAGDLPREVAYLRHTLAAALADAGLKAGDVDPARIGVTMGTTLHGMRAAGVALRADDPAELRRFQGGAVLQAALAGLPVEVRGLGLTGCAACSSGLSSLGLARDLLEDGSLDVVIAGGYDTVSEYAYGGFHALRLISDNGVRPFARDRRGMMLGEGYGVIVLETAAHAAGRGHRAALRLAAVGESSDAHHLTQPDPTGRGAARAIAAGLADAGLAPGDIGLVCAHGTGTPGNEQGEAAALEEAFGDALGASVNIVALKSRLGHTLGGAGAVELVLAAEALEAGILPTTAGVEADDVESPAVARALLSGEPRPAAAGFDAVAGLSIGFGGANTFAVVQRREPAVAEPESAADRREKPAFSATVRGAGAGAGVGGDGDATDPGDDVVVTGLGVVLPGAVGAEAFLARLREEPDPDADAKLPLEVDPAAVEAQVQVRRIRRMSTYVRLTLAATRLAIDDAGLAAEDGIRLAEHPGITGGLLGTAHGSAGYSEDYHRDVIRHGLDTANAVLFAEGVPNAGAAHLSLYLGLTGPCQSVIGSSTAGLDALRLAASRLRSGRWRRAIVSVAEEATPFTAAAYAACAGAGDGHERGLLSEGAVTLVLERRRDAEARGARAHARLEATGSALALASSPTNPLPNARAATAARTAARAAANARSAHADPLRGRFGRLFSVAPLAAAAAGILLGRRDTVTVSTVDPHGSAAAARFAVEPVASRS